MKVITNKERELSKDILEYLSQPIFNNSASAIERESGIPSRTLYQAKERGYIPSQHIYKLICFLAPYGFKYKGYALEVDDQGNLHGLEAKKVVCWKEYEEL